MNLKETYNLIAKEWHKDHQKDDWWVEGTDKFVSFLKPGDLILDVGCGGGTKSKYLIHKGLQVVGIDFAEKMIDIAKAEVPRGTFLVRDLSEINELDRKFDGIFIQAVLLHVPKKEVGEKLKKMIGKIKDDGYLYVAVKESHPGKADEEIKVESDYGYPYKRFFSYFTREEIESHMRDMGLNIVYSDIKPSGKTNWIQVIGKKSVQI